MKRLWIAVWLATGGILIAQEGTEVRRAIPVQPGETASEPPVRRAEPVDPSTYQNPAWMERVMPAQPVEKPAPTPAPTPTPLPPPPEPQPGEEVPVATPVPATDEPPAAGAVEEDSIRFAPAESVPDMNRSLLAGNGFYRRKMYDFAIPEYEKFLIAEPNAKGRDGALFRLGESYRAMGNDPGARNAYQRLLAEFREGEFVGAGAYRLGQIYFANGNFPSAVSMFRKAVDKSDEKEIQLTAKFYEAQALDKLGRRDEAAVAYGELLKFEGDNPYAETAGFYLAENLSQNGKKSEAFDAYVKLSDDAKEPRMKAEATVKAAAIAADLGRTERAKELFDKALEMPELGDWKGVARLGEIRIAYEAGQYDEAAKITDEQLRELPADAVPEALLISANANRQIGHPDQALAMYDRIMRDYPQSTAAGQAQFQRLVCLDATGAQDILPQIDRFLNSSTNAKERAQAVLLKAETLYRNQKYADAVPLYAKVLASPQLPKKVIDQALYKLGWCQLQAGQYPDAALTFTRFLAKNPKSDLAVTAQTQRAVANQKAEAFDAALKDFDEIITKYPDAKERELALQQKALILGQQQKYDDMATVFGILLKDYPKSKAAAQAHYWIGWAAFEKKDYKDAIGDLKKARELDPDGFGNRATLRILLAYYYDQDRQLVAEEVSKAEPSSVPSEVLVWLGAKYFEDGNFAKAEEFLAPLASNPSIPVDPEILLSLAKARIALGKYEEAHGPVQRYLAAGKDPVSRARGLMASAEISLGTGNYEDANKLIEEALLLQPEGKYNGEARLLSGEVLMQRDDYAGAARAFTTIAVLFDDPEITPKALRRAAEAYRKAGNTAEAQKAKAELERRYPDGEKTGADRKGETAKAGTDSQ